MKHLKLFFALFAMLALGVGNSWGAEVTETIKMKGFGGKTNNAYQNVTVSGTSDAGTAMVAYAYNGSNGQVRGNKTSVAGASVTNEDKNKNWSLYNSEAMGGSIKSITVTQTATGNNKFQNNLYVSLGTSSQGSVTATKNAQKQDAGGTANEINFTIDASKGYTYFKLLSTEKFVSNSIAGVVVTVTYETASSGGSEETVYSVTLNQPATGGTIEADKDEAAAGATVTLTATPDAGYKFSAWDVKDANNAVVTVSADGKFTMPESAVTVTASFVAKTQYTIKWNVAEGSVADTKVYEGEALGTLPTAENCSSGKVFVGWTEATSVNADGFGIIYAKATDVPAGNKEYNAVYATEITTGGGGATKYVKATTISDGTYLIAATNGLNSYAYTGQVTGKTYGGYTSVTISGDEIATKPDAALEVTVKVTDGKFSMHDGTSYLYLSSDGNNLNFTTTEETDWILDNGKIKNAAITTNTRYLQFNANIGQERFACYKSTQKDAYLYKKGDGSSTSYTDYSLDCEARQNPFLNITETAFDFGTVAQNETVTKTFTVTGGYLAEDVALTISGTNASFFSVSPATITKADDVEETVTVTYNPTATGDHTATLTIKTGDITKEIALSGKVLAPGKWVLVKDVATLSAGDEIIIAAAAADYAIGAAASNNYKGAAITKVGETANTTTDVTILTVEETGVAEAPYAFKTDGKYLYAAGSGKNYLRAQATNNENGQWAVAITEGVASIVAAKSENHNVMQFNPNNGNPIFACYTSASQSALAIYRNSENVVKPVISGEADFVGSTQVTITAQSGLTVYYTTDGSDPDNTSTQYTASFTINATTTVKAIAYDASSNASGVAEMTFTKHELVNVAKAMALEKDEIAYFDEFEVVKKVEGKGYIYIKDASGHGLIFDYDLESALKDGDRVKGFVGISSPYNNLPEMKPYNVTATDLTITSGTAAEPYDFSSTAIAAEHMNKYVVFKGVEMTEDVDITSHPTLTIGGNSVYLRNQFGKSVTLTSGVKYDIYAFVAIYNTTLQYYFYQANEEGEASVKYTVTYNAGGATGTVPVDNNQYAAGDQVYLESALSLSYEGYEYKGWKVTDVNGNEIPVSNNRFNMPASNVTVTAQWEAIVVTPKEDFSAGVWVLVSDANELAADDYIIVAAKDYNVAMVSYDYDVRKNNCGQTNITKFGKDNCFLTWTEDVGVFQLTASGENYTIQDVNTKQYLYAAGGTTSNHLKATDAVDTDAENMLKYIWEISIVDGITTVKAMSEGRNTLKYNSTATSGQLFSCYASGQKDIVLYKYTTDFYTRDVAKNQYGTICLDKGGVPVSGATFYEVAYKNTQTKRVLVDEVVRLKAGVPYVFLPNANQIKIALDGTTATEAKKVKGLQGTFVEIIDGPAGTAGNILEGKHVLYNNAIQRCGGNCQLPAYRAYFLVDEIPTTEPAQVPGRRRVALDYQGENQATGLDNIGAPENDAVKVLMNGQMIIIRNGEKFNAQGVKL